MVDAAHGHDPGLSLPLLSARWAPISSIAEGRIDLTRSPPSGRVEPAMQHALSGGHASCRRPRRRVCVGHVGVRGRGAKRSATEPGSIQARRPLLRPVGCRWRRVRCRRGRRRSGYGPVKRCWWSEARPEAWCPPNADCALPEYAPLADGAAFDPATESWRVIADAPQPFSSNASVVLVDRAVYVLANDALHRPGGEGGFHSLPDRRGSVGGVATATGRGPPNTSSSGCRARWSPTTAPTRRSSGPTGSTLTPGKRRTVGHTSTAAAACSSLGRGLVARCEWPARSSAPMRADLIRMSYWPEGVA